mmetsp:Transcript_79002/g.178440  ORF Transcript_79002/g.178440 Transcript_79002/m.178440 type:complete len:167 (+) Transcript_79002:1-501(+)
MFGNGCSQFGVTVVQSDPLAPGGANVRVEHVPLIEDKSFGKDPAMVEDGFDRILACLKAHGYAGCRKRHGLSFRATSTDTIVSPEPLRPPPAVQTLHRNNPLLGLAVVCILLAVAYGLSQTPWAKSVLGRGSAVQHFGTPMRGGYNEVSLMHSPTRSSVGSPLPSR